MSKAFSKNEKTGTEVSNVANSVETPEQPKLLFHH